MRGVDAGHHATVQRVLPVQAQAVPSRPEEPEDSSLCQKGADILNVLSNSKFVVTKYKPSAWPLL